MAERAAAGQPERATGRGSESRVSDAARARTVRKELARLESQLDKAGRAIEQLHARMAESASDYSQLAKLQVELDTAEARQSQLEEAWLLAAEDAEG